jgi:hypothetical protein
VSNLVEVDLGKDGIDYIHECLQQGTGLCQKVLRLPLKSGRASALVPERTSVDRAKFFNAGGLLTWRDTINWLADHVRTLWREKPTGGLVFQDLWVRPADPAVRCKPVKKFFDATNVYYFVESSDENIEAIIRETSSFLLVGFFMRISLRDSGLMQDCIVEKKLIDKLARSTKEIFVTAYDREGLVLWRP